MTETEVVKNWLRNEIRKELDTLEGSVVPDLDPKVSAYLDTPDLRRQLEFWLQQAAVEVECLDEVHRLLINLVDWLDEYSTGVFDMRQAIVDAMRNAAVTRPTPRGEIN